MNTDVKLTGSNGVETVISIPSRIVDEFIDSCLAKGLKAEPIKQNPARM